jgi:WD40 repeat protein
MVKCVAFSTDGKYIASGSFDNSVRLWHARTGATARTLNGHTRYILSVAFSLDSKQLVSGDGAGEIRMWNVDSGKETSTMKDPSRTVRSIAFNPDGKSFASLGSDSAFRIWDVTTGTVTRTIRARGGRFTRRDVMGLAFSPDGKRIVTGGEEITVWEVETGFDVLKLSDPSARLTSSVAFTQDGSKIVAGSFNHTVKVWPATGTGTLTAKHVSAVVGPNPGEIGAPAK